MYLLRLSFVWIVLAGGISHALATEPLEAGVALVDITPPVPFRMCGYFFERLSTGTKDPLFARAVVFQQGNETAALVFCDLVGVPLDISTAARKAIHEKAGIPVANTAITGTHTHTGPLYYTVLSDYFHEQTTAKNGSDPYDIAPYRAMLIEKLAEAVSQAKASLAPVTLTTGYAIEDRISFNRRFIMKDGSVGWNPGALNPNIVRPAGPIDPQVGIVLLSSLGKAERQAAIVSFAMHLDTTGGTLYSADYVKSLSERLKREFGPNFKTLFGTGTCGNINHLDVSKQEQRKASDLGEMLGDTVAKAIRGDVLSGGREPALAVRSAKVLAPLQKYRPDEIATAMANMERVGARDLAFLETVEACKIVDIERLKKAGDEVPLEVQVFRLDGDTVIVSLPSEVFVELGLAIKAASPFKTTLVVELANDDVAYIPNKQAFAEGNYEPTNSRVVPGTGEKLVDAAVGLLKELH